MRPIYVPIVVIRRGLVGTTFRGDFVRAHAELPDNSSPNFNIWMFMKIDIAQAAPLSGVGKIFNILVLLLGSSSQVTRKESFVRDLRGG